MAEGGDGIGFDAQVFTGDSVDAASQEIHRAIAEEEVGAGAMTAVTRTGVEGGKGSARLFYRLRPDVGSPMPSAGARLWIQASPSPPAGAVPA